MADLFSVTAPLAIRFADGSKEVMVARLAYRDGLLFLPAFWTEAGIAGALRFVPGPIRGDGPWKVGDAVVTVLGCQGTDRDLAWRFASWQEHLRVLGEAYPEPGEIERLMLRQSGPAAHPGAAG
jgi:hypothetical protein